MALVGDYMKKRTVLLMNLIVSLSLFFLAGCATPPKPTQPEGDRIAINLESINSDEMLKKIYEQKRNARMKNRKGNDNVSQN